METHEPSGVFCIQRGGFGEKVITVGRKTDPSVLRISRKTE